MSAAPRKRPGAQVKRAAGSPEGRSPKPRRPPRPARLEQSAPLLGIVGRPNVGKSTLFNRLCGGHHAIVEDRPGVTRDRRYGESDYNGVRFRVVDTGGLDFESAKEGGTTVARGVLKQSMRAIEEAAVLLFVVDGREGLLPQDREVWERLRRTGKPLVVAANKIDGARHEGELGDLFELGTEQVFGISAAHGRGLPDLLDALVALMPADAPRTDDALPVQEDDEEDDEDQADAEVDLAESDEAAEAEVASADTGEDAAAEHAAPTPKAAPDIIRIALIGRPNAGKSSLVNCILGDERMIVDSVPGTTRDPVDTEVVVGGQRYLIIDTAGIRRRAKVHEPMEKVAVAMAEKAVNRADVAILVIDGVEGIGEQDAKIAGLCHDAGRALIVAFNKRDLFEGGPARERKLIEDRDRQLQFIPWALTTFVSARSGKGVRQLLADARRCHRSFVRRVPTGELNRFFEGIVERHPPPLFNGHPIRLYYITQASVRPPTFMVSVNYPQGMHFSYQRYLQNQIRDTFGFVGTPVRIVAREHRKR